MENFMDALLGSASCTFRRLAPNRLRAILFGVMKLFAHIYIFLTVVVVNYIAFAFAIHCNSNRIDGNFSAICVLCWQAKSTFNFDIYYYSHSAYWLLILSIAHTTSAIWSHAKQTETGYQRHFCILCCFRSCCIFSVFCAAFVRVARETQAICVTGFCSVFVFSIFRVQKLSIYFSFSSVNLSVYAVLFVCVGENICCFMDYSCVFITFSVERIFFWTKMPSDAVRRVLSLRLTYYKSLKRKTALFAATHLVELNQASHPAHKESDQMRRIEVHRCSPRITQKRK